jgi:hypothetical protein
MLSSAVVFVHEKYRPQSHLCLALNRSSAMEFAYSLLDKGYIPDVALRPVIRQLCRTRQKEIEKGEYNYEQLQAK